MTKKLRKKLGRGELVEVLCTLNKDELHNVISEVVAESSYGDMIAVKLLLTDS